MAKIDPGLGSQYSREIKRLVNSDGSYNMVRLGGLRGIRDFYKYLIEISWTRFILFSLASYLLINALFATIYLLIGIEHISGTSPEIPDYLEAFFFSAQTFTSVGYGMLSPIGIPANIVGTLESFCGLMSIALITGLLYGRFSRPKSKLAFSEKVILTPYESGKALMLKIVNKRDSVLLNANVRIIMIMDRGGEMEQFNKLYFDLELVLDRIHFFPLTWTLVHAIDEKSPVYNMTIEELEARNTEILILVEAFDETHSQMVTEKHAYGNGSWMENVKFDRNFRINESGVLELYINELNNVIPVDELPQN